MTRNKQEIEFHLRIFRTTDKSLKYKTKAVMEIGVHTI